MLRVVVLVNALALNAYRFDNFQHPVAGLLCMLAMTLWTGVAIWAYLEPRRRGAILLVLDLGIAIALLLASPAVKGAGFNATVSGFWTMGALLAWAIHFRWRGGFLAGVVLAGTDLAVRDDITQNNYGNAFLLVLGGTIVGFMCESLQLMAAERDRAQLEAVTAAERARLARVVHDGVLQVLALVQRRGPEIGGEAEPLGVLAGEQEAALRRLIRAQDGVVPPAAGGARDLTAALTALESRSGVQVVTPGTPVELPGEVVAELVAIVTACLHNVAAHVGAGAPAWVLLESGPDRVEVSVRDEGPGIPEGRLDEAEAEGRLGVSQSIRGRVADLGGTAALSTGSHGTEWEIVVPREVVG